MNSIKEELSKTKIENCYQVLCNNLNKNKNKNKKNHLNYKEIYYNSTKENKNLKKRAKEKL